MRDDEPLDLSALNPGDEHWRSYVDATLARADDVLRRRREGPLELIAGWTRPLLLAAAAIVALLVPVELMLERREPRVEQIERLVTLSRWHDADAAPSASDFLNALSLEARP